VLVRASAPAWSRPAGSACPPHDTPITRQRPRDLNRATAGVTPPRQAQSTAAPGPSTLNSSTLNPEQTGPARSRGRAERAPSLIVFPVAPSESVCVLSAVMHLPPAMDVAFPLVALLVAVVLVVAILALRRRHAADPTPQPTSSDWIGHTNETNNSHSNKDSDSHSNKDSDSAEGGGVGVSTARRVTVAQAVAERDPATAPLPTASTAVPAPATTTADTTPAPVAGSTAAGSDVGNPPQHPRPAATQPQPAAGAPEPRSAAHPSPDTAAPGAQQRPTATPALSAARSATPTTGNPDNPRDGAPSPIPTRAGQPTSSGDVRDRLLAVLLDNPTQAVRAVTELDAARGHLDRLTEALDAIRRERGVLGEVLARLAATGLRPDQLATLAGLPLTEVHDLLPTCVPSPPASP